MKNSNSIHEEFCSFTEGVIKITFILQIIAEVQRIFLLFRDEMFYKTALVGCIKHFKLFYSIITLSLKDRSVQSSQKCDQDRSCHSQEKIKQKNFTQ